MLQMTCERLSDLDILPPITICNDEHRFFVAEQLREIDKLGPIILEPVGRNTAPAISLAALTVKDDTLLLVLAADHVIDDVASFNESINKAIPLAEAGNFVTFGVVPTEAQTCFGYIKRGADYRGGYKVEKFVEKPTLDVAKDYCISGEYYWNSGMFLFKASDYLKELEKFRPDILKQCKSSINGKRNDLDFVRVDKEAFKACPSESIDYAIMEKTSRAVVVPMNAGWSDIGSWSSLWKISEKDYNGNVTVGDVLMHDSTNSFIRSDEKLIAVIGISDLVIVSTKDVVMVANKESQHQIKHFVEELKVNKRAEWSSHREVFRPWGKYDSIDKGHRYQVKRITVKPGAKLSVQMHHHRAEHWVVVSGIAKVYKGDDIIMLSENESVYIPLGVIHALENPGKLNLELIEVQSGSYLGEDDIIRFNDIYGRTTV